MIGRPSLFTPELADDLCERIASGETLRSITKDDHMPSWRTIWRWLQSNETFRAQYARAREDSADHHAELALEQAMFADDSEASRVQGARLRWDALRWHAGKCAPKRYGERQDVNVTGSLDVRSVFAGINAAHEARTQPRADSDPPVA